MRVVWIKTTLFFFFLNLFNPLGSTRLTCPTSHLASPMHISLYPRSILSIRLHGPILVTPNFSLTTRPTRLLSYPSPSVCRTSYHRHPAYAHIVTLMNVGIRKKCTLMQMSNIAYTQGHHTHAKRGYIYRQRQLRLMPLSTWRETKAMVWLKLHQQIEEA